MIKAVVYDLDGTLLDTLSTIAYYGNAAMGKYGLAQYETDRYRYFAGDGARVLIERMLDACSADKEKYFRSVYEYYNEIYNAAPLYKTGLYEHIKELTDALSSMGIKQAVLSNKPDYAVKYNIDHFFGSLFDSVYGARENIALKPDPEMLLALLAELGVKAEQCLYVGDTDVDMLTGRAAGAYTVGVSWGFRDEDELISHGAHRIASSPMQIIDIMNEINRGIL